MRCEAGIWLPDSDKVMPRRLRTGPLVDGRGTYQYGRVLMALRAVRRWRTAIDVGAHVGTWSRLLAREFGRVVAFEPWPEHAECFRRNLGGAENVRLVEAALGQVEGTAVLRTNPANTAETWVVPLSEGTEPEEVHAAIGRLDWYAAACSIVDVDFLKVDVEGFELFVLRGAMLLLERDLPVVLVEQDERYSARYQASSNAAVAFLKRLGYEVRERRTCDYLLVHPESAHWRGSHCRRRCFEGKWTRGKG